MSKTVCTECREYCDTHPARWDDPVLGFYTEHSDCCKARVSSIILPRIKVTYGPADYMIPASSPHRELIAECLNECIFDGIDSGRSLPDTLEAITDEIEFRELQHAPEVAAVAHLYAARWYREADHIKRDIEND